MRSFLLHRHAFCQIAGLVDIAAAFDRQNTSEEAVLRAHYFAAYRGVPVWKWRIGQNAASFFVLIIGTRVNDPDVVRHEYGHRLQWNAMRFPRLPRYLFRVAIPSVTANLLHRCGRLPGAYYGSDWEAEADRLAGVSRVPAPAAWHATERQLLKRFFIRKKKR